MEEKKVCATCMWYQQIPFGDAVCMNDDSEYADCPSDSPDVDTCEEWEGVTNDD